ncbi:MAG: cell division protein FtsQ [Prevotellaceae bacterium]|nr:cell division protein FtsQ [Prevotellaceae bacterium]
MKMNRTFKVWLFVILFFAVVAYIVYAMLNLTEGDKNELCARVDIEITYNGATPFVTQQSLTDDLYAEGLYPEGKLMTEVSAADIERMLMKNKFLRNVECYKTNNGMEIGKGKVCIRAHQRVPVIYVLPDNADGYYVDAEGTVIPNTSYATNILTATGKIDQQYATSDLAQFATFIVSDEFWSQQTEQIAVSVDRRGRHVVTMVPRVGDHVIYLGTLADYEKKLRRMEIFYEKGLSKVGWNKYSKINLEYDNQVVCTKR